MLESLPRQSVRCVCLVAFRTMFVKAFLPSNCH